MSPDVISVASVKVDLNNLQALTNKAVGFQPSSIIAQSPVKFSEAAKHLLFIAYLFTEDIDREPHDLLVNLPRECFNFLHYTFAIACSRGVIEDLREKTEASYIVTDAGNAYYVLGTGPFRVWHNAIVLNLTTKIKFKYGTDTRIFFNKLLLFFEKEGLTAIFSKYNKKPLRDNTFLLE